MSECVCVWRLSECHYTWTVAFHASKDVTTSTSIDLPVMKGVKVNYIALASMSVAVAEKCLVCF